jgi:hypothetical protein
VRRARAELAEQFETELGKHPDGPILMSLPGVDCRIAVTMLVEISGIDRFANAGHLAVYAGVAPRTHRLGTSIKGEHHRYGGNSRLKRAMYLSAFVALRDPLARAYYDRKRAEGKNHRSALICLARRRSSVLYSMLVHRSVYSVQGDVQISDAQELGTNIHPGHRISFDDESERTGTVEAVSADLRGESGLGGCVGEVEDGQRHLLTNEFRFAPCADLGAAGEFAAPVVDYTARREGVEEEIGVSDVGGIDQTGNGHRQFG